MKHNFIKSVLALALGLISMSAMAKQYCSEPITEPDGDGFVTYKHLTGNTYQILVVADGDMVFTGNWSNINVGVNQSEGAGIGLGNAAWEYAQDGKSAWATFTTATEASVPTNFYASYACFQKSGGTTGRDLVEFHLPTEDVDWLATCPEFKDYTITVYTTNGTPNVHAYTDGGFEPTTWGSNEEHMSTTNYTNTYTYTVEDAPAEGIKVIFYDNSNPVKQTAAIVVTDDAIFNVYYDGDNSWAYTATPTTAHNMTEITIKVNADQTPKIHYWGVADAPAWASDPDMTLVPGYTDWYEYTVSNVDENNGVNYIIRLGSEQSADQSTLVDVCLAASINNEAATNKVTLADTDCPSQLVPEAPHASGKGFGTYQATGVALYDWDGDFAGTNACGSVSLYVVTVGNVIYYKAIAENEGTFENGTDYFCQLRTRKDDDTEMREHWAREMSNDKTTRWTAFGGANNPDLAPYGDVMHLNTYMVMTGCGARTIQTIEYHRDYINNPIIDVVAPSLTSASVTRNISTYTINVTASADDEIFYLFKDITNDKVYVSLTNSIDLPTDGTGVAHTVECYAVDYNGNMSAKQDAILPMESIQVPAAPAPTKAAAGVLSIYSDADGYTSVVNGGSRCAWNGALSVNEIETATNDHAYLYTLTKNEASNWFGWEFAVKEGYKADGMTGIDATEMTALHLDIWSATNGAISVYPIYGGGAPTNDAAFYRVNLTANEWTSVDITLDMLQNVPAEGYDWSSIFQFKFAGCTATEVIAIDNVYFWKETTYTRTTTAGDFGTICLPKGGTIEGATLYNIDYKTANAVAISEHVGAMVAGVAYIFQANATELTVTYAGDAVATPVAGNALIGTFEAIADVPQHMYIISNNQLHEIDGGTGTLAPYRAYLDMSMVSEQPSGAPVRMIEVANPVATGIENATAVKAAKALVNGQLVIVRNGAIFNLNGMLVK